MCLKLSESTGVKELRRQTQIGVCDMLRQWALRQSNDSQILLLVLQETASDVARIKPKESAHVLKAKQPVIIGAEKPLPGFFEMPSPAPRIGTKILYVAADRVF